MKKILIISLLIYHSLCVIGQNDKYSGHVSTVVPSNYRYELVQSNLVAKLTFKIDKYTGDTYQLVVDTQNILSWSKLTRYLHSFDVITDKNKVNYQFFTSGIAAKHTYLMNIDTGATWQLVVNENGEYLWESIY